MMPETEYSEMFWDWVFDVNKKLCALAETYHLLASFYNVELSCLVANIVERNTTKTSSFKPKDDLRN